MLESKRYDWSRVDTSRDCTSVPHAIERLASADTSESAWDAYWQVDGHVVEQGTVRESALPSIRVALIALQACTDTARPILLELLVQLSAGSGNLDGDTVVKACRQELLQSASMFFHLLEFGTQEEKMYAVDLLGLCAIADGGITPRVLWHLQQSLDVERDDIARTFIANTIDDVQQEQRSRTT